MTRDDDVLAELRAALGVLPSAGFEARVLADVREHRMYPARWVWAAGLVASTAAAVLALVLGSSRPLDVERPPPVAEQFGAEFQTTPHVEPRPVRPESTEAATRRTRTMPPRTAAMPPSMEAAAVIVPPGQMSAIRRLVAGVAAGRVAMAPPGPDVSEPLETAPIGSAPPIVFSAVEFRPLSADVSPDLWR
jgi:hypothetical protein